MNRDQDALEYTLFNKDNILNNLMVIANIAIYIILSAMGDMNNTGYLLEKGAMYGPYFETGEWWRLITAMFLHSGFIHIANNMVALFFIGAIVERYFGHIRYIIMYFISGVSGFLLSYVGHSDDSVCVGASGAIFGMFAAVLIIMIFNGQAEYISWKMLILFILLQFAEPLFESAVYGKNGITNVFDSTFSNVDVYGHIGGFAAGAVMSVVLMLIRRRRYS